MTADKDKQEILLHKDTGIKINDCESVQTTGDTVAKINTGININDCETIQTTGDTVA